MCTYLSLYMYTYGYTVYVSYHNSTAISISYPCDVCRFGATQFNFLILDS